MGIAALKRAAGRAEGRPLWVARLLRRGRGPRQRIARLRAMAALNKSGDLLALLPQAPRGRIVPSSRARLDLAAIMEIAAADIGELRRTREMDDGVRAGLGRAGEHHRSPQDPPEQAGVTLPEVRRDESGV